MNIKVIMFGKEGRGKAVDLANEYASRLKHYTRLELVYWPDHDGSDKADQALSKRWGPLMGPASHVILLEENGEMIASIGLAKKLESMQTNGVQQVLIVIGGAYGIPGMLKNDAEMILSLSPMTFPHQIARALLLEQLYRAFTILRGEGYHHGS